MLPETLNIALKEWAVVQRALLEKRQIVLLRKGGLIEETGDFDLKARNFLIMPTYVHETERAGDLQPEFLPWLRDEEKRRPAENRIRFEAACEAVDIVRVDDREAIKRLASQHIWSDAFIDGRYDWEPYKPVFALLCRAYRLRSPIEAAYESEYGGCRSWIELLQPVDAAGAQPAIESGDEFERRCEATKRLLAGRAE